MSLRKVIVDVVTRNLIVQDSEQTKGIERDMHEYMAAATTATATATHRRVVGAVGSKSSAPMNVNDPQQLMRVPCVLYFLLFLSLSFLLPDTIAEAKEPETKDYHLLATLVEAHVGPTSVVAVVQRGGVQFLTHGNTVIGARFVSVDWFDHIVFPGFVIMEAVTYVNRTLDYILQIGLGAGSVPTALRRRGIVVDVVEISAAVVQLASDYFDYNVCTHACAGGETFIMDGIHFVEKASFEAMLYDAVVVDVYTGSNPTLFFTRETVGKIKSNLLVPNGLLIMNYFGFSTGVHAHFPQAIYATLQAMFSVVRCYSESDNPHEKDAVNLVFYASNENFAFHLPTEGDFKRPMKGTYHDVVKTFQDNQIFHSMDAKGTQMSWELVQEQRDVSISVSSIHGEDGVLPTIITEEMDMTHFHEAHEALHDHMQHRLTDLLPLSYWAEVQMSSQI